MSDIDRYFGELLAGRSFAELLGEAKRARASQQVQRALQLGYLAGRAASSSDEPKIAEADVHLWLSETMGEVGYIGFERIHASEAARCLNRAQGPVHDRVWGALEARLARVSSRAGEPGIADYHLMRAAARFRSLGPATQRELYAVLLDRVELALKRAGLDRKSSVVASHLRSASDLLDEADAVLAPEDRGPLERARIHELFAVVALRAGDFLPDEHAPERRHFWANAAREIANAMQLRSHVSGEGLAAVRGMTMVMAVLIRQGQFDEASALDRSILNVMIANGYIDPLATWNSTLLAACQGNVEQTIARCAVVMSQETSRVREVASKSGEAVTLSSLAGLRLLSAKCLAVLSTTAERRQDSARRMLTILVQRKALVATAESRFWRTLRGPGSEHMEAVEQLVALRDRVRSRVTRDAYQGLWRLIRELERAEEQLEVGTWWRNLRSDPGNEELIELVAEFGHRVLDRDHPWQAVECAQQGEDEVNVDVEHLARVLPAESVLVEFVRIDEFEATRDLLGASDRGRYWALLLRPDGHVRAYDLGDAAEIDAQVYAWREFLDSHRSLDSPERQTAILGQLHSSVWAPIRLACEGVERILLSPDGMLAMVPFAALYDRSDKRFLIEKHTLCRISSGRELLEPREVGGGSRNPPALVADPEYDLGVTEKTRVRTFLRLQGTEKCDERFRALFGHEAVCLTRHNATGEKVRNLAGPRILHFATHGVFEDAFSLDDSEIDQEDALARESAYVGYIRTLCRSGLALSGANGAPKFETERDAGFLTAFDVMGMDLRGTELVVLAACDTGRGTLHDAEGVLGLPRSFRIAGAQQVVMSLWRLSDMEAVVQETEFYRRVLGNQEPASALREVQQSRILSWRRELGEEPPPAVWAAYVVEGHWDPLQRNQQ